MPVLNEAPGVYVNVVAAPPSPDGNAPTGTWLITGTPNQGPTGVAIPITSMTDYANFLGTRTTTSATIYDSLDEFFHDGGVLAYVSRIVGPSAIAASVILKDTATPTPVNTLAITANGAGTWANAVSVTVATGGSIPAGGYTLSILNGTTVVAKSPNLYVPQDAINWAAGLPAWQALVVIVNDASATSPPNNNPGPGNFPLTGGVDNFAGITETQWTNALTAFTQPLGPGQVSAPGHTTAAGYLALNNHAINFNRVPLFDVADNSSAAALVSQSSTFQASATDSSYGAFFAPWVQIPGISSVNPGASSPVPTRTVPPTALAAALMANSDKSNDANAPAAGSNGQSTYAIGVTNQYSPSDLALLNGAGINAIKPLSSNNIITLYGYRSTSLDPNWVYLNNVRFRMQVVNDFNIIGEQFIFTEIDGQGHLFSRFNGALSGKCQTYWTNGSLYGATPGAAFQVNTGPQVNTSTTIASGQLLAEVNLHMSDFGEFVTINVVKFAINSAFPA